MAEDSGEVLPRHGLEELDLPATPAGRQARWYLAHLAEHGARLTVEEIAEHMACGPQWSPEQQLEAFLRDDGRPYEFGRVLATSADEIGVVFDYGDDRPFRLTLFVEPGRPHRIVRTWWARDLPDDIVIRQAEATDSAALNDLEVRAPMTLGEDTTVVYDRGTDFLAFSRLMDENVCFVAERAGELLGIACGAAHHVRIGGQQHRVMLLHHLRVPVVHRKLGVFSTLNGYVFGFYEGRTDGAYGYTALDNAEAMRINGPGTWETGVFRCVVPTTGAVASGVGRAATEEDSDRVIDVLNRCHADEEVFLPYSSDSWRSRLARAPELYSWREVRVGEGAVLGVWAAGLRVSVQQSGASAPSKAVRAVALDHGFLPGHEGAFMALLDDVRAELAARGHTELTFVLSEASPAFPLVAPIATRKEPFAFRMAIPEPDGTVARGVYVDTVYF
ncbi:MAG TPA: hypothetical protein VM143_02255 [Acidimicrobiales bacterium]|nr:hypothetical protein [Acidimicrobiales bacterium]